MTSRSSEPQPHPVTRETCAFYRAEWDGKKNVFAAGEDLGVTVVVAIGTCGGRLQRFVRNELGGHIEHPPDTTQPEAA